MTHSHKKKFRFLGDDPRTSTLTSLNSPCRNMDVRYLSLSCLSPCLLCLLALSVFLLAYFLSAPPPAPLRKGALQMRDDPVISAGLPMFRKTFLNKPSFQGAFFVGIFMGRGWCLDCIWGFWVDIYSCTSISHRVQKQWNLLPWLIKRSAVYSAQGAPLPVINRAARCCRQETLCGYKYGACHCCDYSRLSAMTPHCLLPVDFFSLCIRQLSRTRPSAAPSRSWTIHQML